MAGVVDQLDQQIADLFAGWNVYSTLIVLALFGYLTYLVVSNEDPDTHPMILQRQATASSVRQTGESAVYRSSEAPHGFPLRSGLNVKAPDAPAYAGGKDGDLRDIWRRVTGEIPLERNPRGPAPTESNAQGKIMTIFGKEQVTEHNVSEITKEIVVIGSCIKKSGATRIAIYLPNSIEFLTALFACSFYGLSPILIPYNQPQATVVELLAATRADALIAEAGSVSLEELPHKSLKQVIWVVEKTSRHLDWTEVPKEIGGHIDVCMWHQLIQDHQDLSSSGMPNLSSSVLPNVVTIWLGKRSETQIVEFTQANMVAAIGALSASLPPRQRLNSSDLFVSADSWTNTYALCWTLGALFSHASIAINSVAGPDISLDLVTRSIAPTVVLASAETADNFHAETSPGVTGGLKRVAHRLQTNALDAGRMPADTILTSLNAPHRAAIGATPGKLRLLLVSERVGAESPPLSSDELSDIRIFTGARVMYALTAAKVAGAIAQTGIFDYRRSGGSKNKHSHFGAPLSSVEIKVVDTATHKTTDDSAKGEIVVSGPAVAGGEVNLGVLGKFNDDMTIAYV